MTAEPSLAHFYETNHRSLWLNSFWKTPTAVSISVGFALFTEMFIYGLSIPVLPSMLYSLQQKAPSSTAPLIHETPNTPDSFLALSNDSEEELSGWLVGFLFGLYAVGLLISTPIFGLWADRIAAQRIPQASSSSNSTDSTAAPLPSRRLPMLVGTGLLLTSTLIFIYSNQLGVGWLFGARLLQGMAASASWTVGLSTLADVYSPEELGVVMGGALSANTVGSLLGPPVGGFLYQHVSKRAPFLFAFCLAFLDGTLRFLTKPQPYKAPVPAPFRSPHSKTSHDDIPFDVNETNEKTIEDDITLRNRGKAVRNAPRLSEPDLIVPRDEVASSESLDTLSTTESQPSQDTRLYNSAPQHGNSPSILGLFSLLREWELRILCLSTVVISSVISGLESTLPLHLRSMFNMSESQTGAMFIAIVVPDAIVSIMAGNLGNQYSRKKMAALGMLTMSLAGPMIALPTFLEGQDADTKMVQTGWTLIALFLFGVAYGISLTPIFPELADFVTRVHGGSAFGQVYALFLVSFSIGLLVGPVLATAMYEHFSFFATQIACSLLLLICAPLLLYSDRLKVMGTSLKSSIYRDSSANPELFFAFDVLGTMRGRSQSRHGRRSQKRPRTEPTQTTHHDPLLERLPVEFPVESSQTAH